MPKLTDRTLLGGVSLLDDLFHVVRDGISYKRAVQDVLATSIIPYRYTLGGYEIILLKADRDSPNYTNVDLNDILVAINPTTERMIVAISKGSFAATITNLEDRTKFLRFIDTNALL